MPIEVRLPDLGDSVTHAKVATWLKREGDRIKAGEVIAEVETDKTNVEIEAPGSGTLLKIHVGAGSDGVEINTLLAVIDDGETAEPSAPTPAEPERTAPKESVRREEPVAPLAFRPPTVSAAPAEERPADAAPHAPAPLEPAVDDGQIAASPLARRMAFAAGIPLATIVGTGPGGRITKQDVDGVLRPEPPAPRAATAAAVARAPVADTAAYETAPMSQLRRVTAERLTQAKQTIPHFYLQIDCNLTAVAAVRQELNARGADKLSMTAFALRATALALIRVPAANSAWVDGAVRVYPTADIAVAVETPAGLIAPVIRNAERKSLLSLNGELRTLAERARAGKLKPDEYTGGTFTVSNLGMYGVTGIFPIINPPQACILGLGAVEERPVVRDHALAVGSVMTCTLSADHRAIDGATGAAFLAAFRGLIEDPWALIL